MKSAAKTMSQYFYTAHPPDLFIHHWIVRGSIDLLKPSYTTFGILTPSSLALVQYLVHGGGTINVCWIKLHFLNHQLNNNIFLKKGNGAWLIDEILGFLVLFIFLSIVLNTNMKNVTRYIKIKCRLWLTTPLCQLSWWISITVIFFFKKPSHVKLHFSFNLFWPSFYNWVAFTCMDLMLF